MAGLVQYYVMKRAKHPITGEIVRGKTAGATRNPNGSINAGAALWFPNNQQVPGPNGSLMSTTAPLTDADRGQVDGEPWILHSVHFSVDDAIEQAQKVVSSVGSENLRILQTLAHEVKLSLV